MADNITVARPYAQALFDIAHGAGELGPWSESLSRARELLAGGEVVAYLGDPHFSDERRLEFLTGLFAKAGVRKFDGTDRRGLNFLKLLLEYRRLAALPEIAQRFEELKAEVEGVVDVTVTSAGPISEAQKDAIAKALRVRLGREVKLATQINGDLIGGAVIKAGDVVIDGSLRARLQGLATALAK